MKLSYLKRDLGRLTFPGDLYAKLTVAYAKARSIDKMNQPVWANSSVDQMEPSNYCANASTTFKRCNEIELGPLAATSQRHKQGCRQSLR